MGFRFEKLYADLVTEDGTVCVAYVAWLDAWGTRTSFAGVELYWPDGRREVLHSNGRAADVLESSGILRLVFDVPGGPLVVEQLTTHGAWRPAGAPPCDGLSWSVKAARAEATARWLSDRSRPELRGLGYSDVVAIGRPVRGLGLETLRWGRIHLPESTIVYDAIELDTRRTWTRAATWSADGVLEHALLEIAETAPDTRVRLDRLDELVLEPQRVLHEGDAVDDERFPGLVERVASRILTGPALERRALSRPRGGWALHEAVRFGARATPS